MISFSLDHQSVTLANLNTRAELHGEDREPAADLKLTWTAPNAILSEFDPDLRYALFRLPERDGDQVDLINDPDFLPIVKFPKLGSLKWGAEIVGAEVVVHFGTSGKSDVVLADCIVDGFTFELIDGGSVAVSLRVRCHPDEKQVGKLYSLIQRETEVSITPPCEDDAEQEAA